MFSMPLLFINCLRKSVYIDTYAPKSKVYTFFAKNYFEGTFMSLKLVFN